MVNGEQPSLDDVAKLAGVQNVREVRDAMRELERRMVFSRDEAGRIYSRRMVRDEEKRLRDRANGLTGGSPLLKPQGVNPPINGKDNSKDNARAGPGALAREQRSARVEAKDVKYLKTNQASRETAAPFAPFDWVPLKEWKSFDAMRTAKSGKAWTNDGRRFAINTLERLRDAGQDSAAVLRQAVERSWSGLFPVKAENGNGNVDWMKSEAATLAKQKELGLSSRGGESWTDLRARIRKRLQDSHP